jgi:hypothetical protein
MSTRYLTLIILGQTLVDATMKDGKGWRSVISKTSPIRIQCFGNLPSTNDIYRFKQLFSTPHNIFSYLTCTHKTPMPKSKRSTPKRRPTPYPTPATPANPNPRSAPTRSFAPPLGFSSTFSNPVYPQYSLTPFELGQTLHDYCQDLQNGMQRSPNADENGNASLTGVHSVERDDKGASGVLRVGEGPGRTREGRLGKIIGVDGIDKSWGASKTPNLSESAIQRTIYWLSTRLTTGSPPTYSTTMPGLTKSISFRSGSSAPSH